MTGWQMLLRKEILRFWRVVGQTVGGPVLTAMLYLLIFGHALESHVQVYEGVSYTAFLVPGLAMMSLLQNAFANSSSSLVASKVMGNLIFLQLTPLTHRHWFAAYVGAAVVRGWVVCVGVFAGALWFTGVPVHQPLWILIFGGLGAVMMGALGIVAGLWSDKFEQMAAFQNFIVVPMTFLSGVFYSVHALPSFWQSVSQLNPFFYMIDGFRHGFFGLGDVSPWRSLAVVAAFTAGVCAWALYLLRVGYRIRN